MEQHYSQSDDPWGNTERQLYQTILKPSVTKVFDHWSNIHEESIPFYSVYHYDIGCGGGNILDTFIRNTPNNILLSSGGCDISLSAIERLKEKYPEAYSLDLCDCEHYNYDEGVLEGLAKADIVSIIDVMYYFGAVRDYRQTLDEIWKTIKPGAIILVADTIIPYQRRSYFMKKHDCVLLEEYTEYCAPAGKINGSDKNRYLKVKIYLKK